LLMCLDNKKLLSLETVMATNPWMYSRTQKSNMEKNLTDLWIFLTFNSDFSFKNHKINNTVQMREWIITKTHF
jgi:hypothetical protein